jgi:hypothetical protein
MKYVTIAMLIFMLLMFLMGYYMVFSTNEKPQKNYYEQDLNYEKYQKAKQNIEDLPTKPLLRYDSEKRLLELNLISDTQNLQGSLQILKVSDETKDQTFQLSSKNIQHFLLPVDLKGLCNIIISWTNNGKNFLYEEKMVL